jgi:hypothetical protein
MSLRHTLLGCALPAALLLSAPAFADTSVTFQGSTFVNKGLVGVARVPSNSVDKFGDTVSLGSSMAVLPGSWKKKNNGTYTGTFLMLPDRGWNTGGTVDYPGRLHRYQVTFTPYYGTDPAGSQNQLTMTYKTSTLFKEPKRNTTGIDPLFVRPAAGGLPALPVDGNNHIAVDDEGVVYPGDGTIWISDEYGPYVYHYSSSGKLLNVIRPPEAVVPKRLNAGIPVDQFSANAPPNGGPTYNTGNPVSGRQNNQGAEGLSISADHKTLYVFLQSALIQDLDATSSTTISNTRRNTRLLAYDISGATPALIHEYVVQLPLFNSTKTAAESELYALNDHQFLVLARDSGAGHGLATAQSVYRKVDLIDVTGATDIANTDYDLPQNPVAPGGNLNPAITPVAYTSFVDINDAAQLAKFGLHNGAPNDDNNLNEKWESIAILPVGDKAAPDDYFMVVAADNDFITQDGHTQGKPYQDASGINNDTLMLVYRLTIPGLQPH